MGQQDRSSLKQYFQTGDIPTEGQYVHLIDSKANMVETNSGSLFITNAFSGSKLDVSGEITASGNVKGASGSFTRLDASGLIKGGSHLILGTDGGNQSHIYFDGATDSRTSIGIHGDPEDLQIKADDDIILQPDDDVLIKNSSATFATFDGDKSALILNTGAGYLEVAGNITSSKNTLFGDASTDSHKFIGQITASHGISGSSGDIVGFKSGSFQHLSTSTVVATGILKAEHLHSTDDVQIDDDLTVTGDINANGNIVGDDGTDITNIETISCDNVAADADATTFMNLAANSYTWVVGGSNAVQLGLYKIEFGLNFHVTASCDISSSGTITGLSGSFGSVSGKLSTPAQPRITSVGSLTSITSTGNSTLGNASTDTHTFTGAITASSDISSSGAISSVGNIASDGNMSANIITATSRLQSDSNLIVNGNSNSTTLAIAGIPTSDPGISGVVWRYFHPTDKKWYLMISTG